MKPIASSFRDPSGTVFTKDGIIFRAVFQSYQPHYDQLMASGLYQKLVDLKYLIPHSEEHKTEGDTTIYKIIKPMQLDLITYPQEWCFGQLKEAALLTLQIQKEALASGMVLKDASPYNVQFKDNRAIHIDTLSLETYIEGAPWVAYRQFCEQFFAPLVLMSATTSNLPMLRMFPAGVPLDVAVKLIPWYKKLKGSIYLNLVLHQRLQRTQGYKNHPKEKNAQGVSKASLLGHTQMLMRTISKMKPAKQQSKVWSTYYYDESMNKAYASEKEVLVTTLLENIRPDSTIDLGANTGRYSKLASVYSKEVLALEKDPLCLEDFFQELKREETKNILPLLFDIMEPAPPAGWEGKERRPLWERRTADLVMVLAVLHHISIGENVPFEKISSQLALMGNQLLIEFVSAEDPNAAKLLRYKPELLPRVSLPAFLQAFACEWEVVQEYPLKHSSRILFYMKKKIAWVN